MARVLFEFGKDFSNSRKGDVKKLDRGLANDLKRRGIGFYIEEDDPPVVKKPLTKKAKKNG
jgi:hypothetical protein